MQIPNDPQLFFSEFFARQYEEDRRYPRTDMPGAAVFEVLGQGVWNFRVQGGELTVSQGRPDDTVLQIAVSSETFQKMFIERTQAEVDRKGKVSEGSKNVFLPLFFDESKRRLALKNTETLRMRLRHEGEKHDVLITPGNGAHTEPRATVSVDLENFFGMTAGKKKAPFLFLRGKLKVAGDVGYALKMNGLLG